MTTPQGRNQEFPDSEGSLKNLNHLAPTAPLAGEEVRDLGLTVLMAFFDHQRITLTQTLSLEGEGSMGGNLPSPRPSPMQGRA